MPAEDEASLPDLPFECECLAHDGSMCGARFASLQQLATHMRRTKGGEHGVVPDHFRAVVTHQCHWCCIVHCNIREPEIMSNRPCGTKYARAEAVSTHSYLACLKPCDAQLVSTKRKLLMLFKSFGCSCFAACACRCHSPRESVHAAGRLTRSVTIEQYVPTPVPWL